MCKFEIFGETLKDKTTRLFTWSGEVLYAPSLKHPVMDTLSIGVPSARFSEHRFVQTTSKGVGSNLLSLDTETNCEPTDEEV